MKTSIYVRRDPHSPIFDVFLLIPFLERYIIEEYFLQKKDLEAEKEKKEEEFNHLQFTLNSLNTNVEVATKNVPISQN